jgi:hypothetical protein
MDDGVIWVATTPDPVRTSVAGPAGSLLLIVILPPLIVPANVGESLIGRTQLAVPARFPLSPAADRGHSLAGLAAVSMENGPLKVAPVNDRICEELFVIVSGSVLLVPSATFPNARAAGLNFVAAIPEPDRGILIGEFAASLETTRDPAATEPSDAGVNVRAIKQLPPGGIEPRFLHVVDGSNAYPPGRAIEMMLRAPVNCRL